jgi:SAM-dependent methyltransferase
VAQVDIRLGGVDELFRGGELVIDLGCGDGRWLDKIGPRYRTAIGVDRIANPGSAGWQYVQADIDAGLPFDDAVADAVRANQVIEHIREPVAFLAEARRTLRPGGLLVVTTPNVRALRHILRLAVQGRGPMTSAHEPGASSGWDDGHLHYFTPGDLVRIARSAGFASPQVSALISPTGRFKAIRGLLSRMSGTALVREFLSGNILLIARR